MDRPRPLEHLAWLNRTYPEAAKIAADYRSARGKSLPDWPEYVFLPFAGAVGIASHGKILSADAVQKDHVARVAALVAWRLTKGIYRFDDTMLLELAKSKLDKELPSSVLFRLPEWCVYVDLRGQLERINGFYASLELDMNLGHSELRLLVDVAPEEGEPDFFELLPIPIHLGGTLEQGLEKMLDVGIQNARGLDIATEMKRDLAETVNALVERSKIFVNLVLYLCAEEPDVLPLKGGLERPSMPVPKRVKGGEKLFAVEGARAWGVGWRIGAALNRSRAGTETLEGEESGRNSPRAHVRAGHFHHFWRGPRGNQELFVKWLPPMMVNFDSSEELPAVIRRVTA